MKNKGIISAWVISVVLSSRKTNCKKKWGISQLAGQLQKKLATNTGRGNQGKTGFLIPQDTEFLYFTPDTSKQ